MIRVGSTSPSILLVLFTLNFTPALNGFACLSSPCIHGICVDDLNSTFFCYCIDGYTGFQCQTNWNDCWSSPCQNGGMCIDGIASFNCTCPPGFIGDLCEEDFNECDSNPCLNNGTCIDATNGYICKCLPGYSGIHCEIDVAVCNATGETRCFNGGVCLEGPGETFSCQCQTGWGGVLCENEIDECISAPCQNGAVCIDQHANYECACLFGYTGRNCEEVLHVCTENPCKNGALCLVENNQSNCYCVPDFHGEFCEFQYDECQLGPRCLNGGTCIDGVDNFTCSCPSDLIGVLCECIILNDKELDCNYRVTSTSSTIHTSTTPTTTSRRSTFSTTTIAMTAFTTDTSIISTTLNETSIPFAPKLSTTIITTEEVSNFDTSTKSVSTVQTDLSAITDLTEVPNLIFSETTSQSTADSFKTTIQPAGPSSESSIYDTSTLISISSHEPAVFSIDSAASSTELLIENYTDVLVNYASSTQFETTSKEHDTSTSTEIELTSITPEGRSTSTNITKSPGYDNDLEASYYETTSIEINTDAGTDREVSSSPPETTENLNPSVFYSSTKESRNFDRTISSTIQNLTSFETISSTYTPTMFSETVSYMDSSTINRGFTYSTELFSISDFLSDVPSTESTTWEYETTPKPMVDCTIPDQQCQNGGTCIYASKGHQCECPFDAEGLYCEIKLGIKDAAFTSSSFISHHLKNLLNITIEFTVKTFSISGVLFYAVHDKTYMTLYIQDGFLVFKFSCGYQTMLLSELKTSVNNGFKFEIKASLEYSTSFTHCNASIQVNNTLSMAGDQMARFDRFTPPLTAWLHLGNAVGTLNNIPVSGFTGCMSDLKISGKKIDIYKDATDGSEIAECSSLVCLSNPCQNGGSCSSTKDSWTCQCKNGYLGEVCDLSVCDDNPCLYGGTCVPFSNSGYICLCPFGKHGHFCENDLKISEPHFSSSVRGLSSFAAYTLPNGISEQLEIQFRFHPTTIEQISLLLFIGQNKQHDFYSDHLAVSFVKGYILLTWNMGSGPRRIFTSSPIKSGATDYLVKLGYRGRRAWLYVENLGNVTGRSPGKSAQLDTVPLLYLGGHDAVNFSTLPHDLPFHTGFLGCIFNVKIKSGGIVLPLQGVLSPVGRAVGQCHTTECHEQSCQNGGVCVHHGNTFMCLCQENWYGPLCSSQQNLCESHVTKCSSSSQCVPQLTDYECDCSLGRSGIYCENEETISDISFTGQRSFLHIRPFDINSSKLNIEMELRILKDSGVVFFVGSKDAGFVCLNLQNSLLELKMHSGTQLAYKSMHKTYIGIIVGKNRKNTKDPLTVRSSKLLLKGTWHKIQFGIYRRKVYLHVDRVINVEISEHDFSLDLLDKNIYLGGLPDLSELPIFATSNLPSPYTGCLRHLAIDDKKISLIANDDIIAARNVIDCDGTPCGGELCLNGGTCWLDSFMKPHCSCISPYYGNRCEKIPECTDATCRNGRCLNSTCLCYVGFAGDFCENKTEIVSTPAFTGNSYLIIPKAYEKKRNIRKINLNSLYLNFTTAKDDALMIWSRRDIEFIGLGLENGYLKIVYSLKNSNKTIVEIPPYYKVADGLWHSLEITFEPFSIRIDNKTLFLTFKENRTLDIQISMNQLFFIGGLPSNINIIDETFGLFHEAFEGCIEAFGTDSNKIITDFISFEGLNINVCKFV